MTIPVVLVQVRGNKFSYWDHLGDLQPGDRVVVPFGDGFHVGTVSGLPETDKQRAKATKWIVSKIDMEKWETLTALRPPPEAEKVEIKWHATMLEEYIKSYSRSPFEKTVKIKLV